MNMPQRYFCTTALPYVNASPHLGFVLELVQTDAYARFLRLKGHKVYYLTGADENSLKNVLTAKEKGLPVQEFVNQNAERFRHLKEAFHLSYDDFIRTTEERHKKGVLKLWQKIFDQGDIYKKNYEGLYCIGCEAFYKENELINGFCPEHKNTKPIVVKEENYFFKLSRYQKEIEQIIANDKIKIVPEFRKNEILNFIKQGLEDFSISRSQERAGNWGIRVRNDENQIIYVWFDALTNYISALGYGENSSLFTQWWEEGEVIHFIGKGISRFHAIYWPAMLLSAGLPLPQTIFIHGYLTITGEKISKSQGAIIDPFELVKTYDPEVIRYFLLREFSPFEDGDFSFNRLNERYTSDLSLGLGNLISRIMSLGDNYHRAINLASNSLAVENFEGQTLMSHLQNKLQNYDQAFYEFRFNDAVASLWELVSLLDKYITFTKPWVKIEQAETVLANLVLILVEIIYHLQPIMPEISRRVLEDLQLGAVVDRTYDKQTIFLKKISPLFPRRDK